MYTAIIIYLVVYIFSSHRILCLSYKALSEVEPYVESAAKTLIDQASDEDSIKTNVYKGLLRNIEDFTCDVKRAVFYNTLLTQIWMCPVVLILTVMDEDDFIDTYTLEFKRSMLNAIDQELEELDENITPISTHINLEENFLKDDDNP